MRKGLAKFVAGIALVKAERVSILEHEQLLADLEVQA